MYEECERCGDDAPGQLVLIDGREEALCFLCWHPIRHSCKVIDWINKYGKLQHSSSGRR